MKNLLRLFSIFLVLLAFPLGAAADPIIEVAPMTHDFGDIQVDTSSTTIVTISNINGHVLVVSDIGFGAGSSPEFSITTAPALPAVIPVDGAPIDIEVAFTPSAEGSASAVLEIASNDPDDALVKVNLSGVGVAVAPPPVTIADILAFFDESVANGTLYGNGPGKSANGRKKAHRNKIKAAGDIIEDGADACEQLSDTYQRCDGLPRPPEFVAGPAAPTLAGMILQLMADLGCE